MARNFNLETRRGCPACDGSAEVLYRCSFDHPPISQFINAYYRETLVIPGEYRIERCQACGTMFQAEVGSPALLAKLYGEWIKAHEPEDDVDFMFDVTNPKLSRDGHEILTAASFLGLRPADLQTLDYGAGWAGWARVAKALGCRSHSFDLATARQKLAESQGILPDSGRYHFINTEQVLEHVTDPATLVRQLADKLLTGGILKVSVPSNRGVAATLERLAKGQPTVRHDEIMPVQPLEHVNCFTREGLAALGKRFGLVEVRPSYWQRFAFLRTPGTLDFTSPKRALKELIRPFWQWRNPANLYVWLRKA